VYSLLTEERVCDIILPRLTKRQVLEETSELGPRKSRLLDVLQGEARGRSESPRGSKSRSGTPRSMDSRSRSTSRSGALSDAGSRYISRSPSRSRSRSRSRSGSISPDKMEIAD